MFLYSHRIDDFFVQSIEQARKVIPVNINILAESLGLTILEEDDLEQAGFIEFNESTEKFIIHVNKNDYLTRKKFTIAHELAHFLLHSDEIKKNGSLDRNMSQLTAYTDKKEAEANALAAEILMPMDEISALVKFSEIKTIEELANKLEVSEKALKIKLGITS